MITIQVESFPSVQEEIRPLWEAHYKEVAADQDIIKLNPCIEGYIEYDKAGALKIITARVDGELAGYAFFVLMKSMHYQQIIMAANDLFYVAPKHRARFIGLKLLRKSEQVLKELGVNQIHMREKVYARFSGILEKAGYIETEVVYRKTIQPVKE